MGGQGVVLAGQILGRAAIISGKNAVQTQSYGSEARGSIAKSEVIISNAKIGFPHVRKCDILVIMSQTALEKHLGDLKDSGLLLIDSSHEGSIPKTEAKIYKIPVIETAKKEFGVSIYANMIMLGVLIHITSLIEEDSVEKAIIESVPKRTVEDNLKAFKKGLILKLYQLGF